MSNKKIHLILLEKWPCPGSHYLHTKKFLQSFESHGFSYSEIKNENEIAQIMPGDIVYLSNHGFNMGNLPISIFEKISARKAFQILWYWHDFYALAADLFPRRFVLTGEHFHAKPSLEDHVKCWNIQQEIDEYVPLTFASSLSPNVIGTLSRQDKYLAHFIGNGYKKEINNRLRIRFRGIKIVNTPPFISENERQQIFLSSKVALGWHSDGNIQNNAVVERVFEGLAFGNLVISDTKTASEITDGIVEFSNTYEGTRELLLRVKKDEKFLREKVEAGHTWAKSKGTYFHVAKNFLDFFDSH